jgi:hypothetical protein
MGQPQFMTKIMNTSKSAAFISFILNIKKDFDYLCICFVLASGIIISNDCDQVCNYLHIYFIIYNIG